MTMINNVNSDADLLADIAEVYYLGLGRQKDYDRAFQYFRKAADMGHAYSLGMMGYFLEKGYGTGADLNAAKVCYEQAFEYGDIEAGWHLGDLYKNGIPGSLPADESTAYNYYLKTLRRVEENDDDWNAPEVYLRVGRCLFHGVDTEPDVAASYDYFISAIEGYLERIESGDLACMEELDEAEEYAGMCEKELKVKDRNTGINSPS